jgi:hypothetical protein
MWKSCQSVFQLVSGLMLLHRFFLNFTLSNFTKTSQAIPIFSNILPYIINIIVVKFDMRDEFIILFCHFDF